MATQAETMRPTTARARSSRTIRAAVATLVALSALFAAAPAARAGSSGSLDRAKAARAAAEREARAANRSLHRLLPRYERLQRQLASAARATLDAYEERQRLAAEMQAAQARLEAEASYAYESGANTALQLLLGARTLAQLSAVQEYTGVLIQGTVQEVAQLDALKTSADRAAADLQRQQALVAAASRQMQALVIQLEAKIQQAQAAAQRAGVRVRGLEREAAAVAAAQAAADQQSANLGNLPSGGFDQSALLALLGPTGGRTCSVPTGMQPTGQHVSGLASWYGWDFAGQHTATGAVYDPRLFTAANKTLPLDSFLLVRFDGRCAVVLVNDRGPYGYGRSFDLSEGVATYLGYKSAGVVNVSAEVLVPAKPTPGYPFP